MEEKELAPLQKMILVCAMAQLSIEYIDALLLDPEYNFMFVRNVKRDARNHQRTLESLITKITHGQSMEVKDQLNDTYAVVSKLIEGGLIWPEKESAATQS